MKYMWRRAGYTWTDYKTNTQITKELKITPILDKLLEYKRNWKQHVNRMPLNRLARVMKHNSPTGRRNHGSRPLKRLLDTWDRNGSTSGPTAWQIYDDDDDDDDTFAVSVCIKQYVCPSVTLCQLVMKADVWKKDLFWWETILILLLHAWVWVRLAFFPIISWQMSSQWGITRTATCTGTRTSLEIACMLGHLNISCVQFQWHVRQS